MSRRTIFQHPQLDSIKIFVDIPEEIFQDLKEKFGLDHLRAYIGSLGAHTIKKALHQES